MISCIICCRIENISKELSENIKSTIGTDYEIIIINNSSNQYSIFSAYNEGIKRSHGEILCFMHDDILFHTDNWGKIVRKSLTDAKIGIVGAIGSLFLSDSRLPWWFGNAQIGQLIQGNTNAEDYSVRELKYWNHKQGNSVEVAIVDGMWFCARKEIFDNGLQFDEENFNGFHCYDLDICLQAHLNNLQVHVLYDLFIEHKSLGNTDASYYDQLAIWHNKWEKMLPMTKGNIYSESEIRERNAIMKKLSIYFDAYHTAIQSPSFKIGSAITAPLSWLRNI